MRTPAWILTTMFVALGMSGFSEPQSSRETAKVMDHSNMQDCPMMLSGVDFAVAETANGIAVTFTTNSANVAELRRRVEWLANMQALMERESPMKERLLPGVVKYEVLANGARLTLTPKDTSKLQEFRTQVRSRVDEMAKGNCPMMDNMMRAMTR